MPVRIAFLYLFLFVGNASFGQQLDVPAYVNKVKLHLQRAIPVSEHRYQLKASQYFILDIKLDSATGKGKTVDFFGKCVGDAQGFLVDAIKRIQADSLTVVPRYSRILIPIVVLFPEVNLTDDFPIIRSTADRELSERTFLAKDLVISVYPVLQKQ